MDTKVYYRVYLKTWTHSFEKRRQNKLQFKFSSVIPPHEFDHKTSEAIGFQKDLIIKKIKIKKIKKYDFFQTSLWSDFKMEQTFEHN